MKLPVIALAAGFYGGSHRLPDDRFNIAKAEHLGSWMLPDGWEAKKDPKTGKVTGPTKETKAIKEAAERAEAEQQHDHTNDELASFGRLKDFYGPEGDEKRQVKGSEAVEHAFKASGLSKKNWNELSDKDRTDRIMASVRDLIKEKQEAADAEDADSE